MPWGTQRSGDKVIVRRKNRQTGKLFGPPVGRHDSQQQAEAQIAALHANVGEEKGIDTNKAAFSVPPGPGKVVFQRNELDFNPQRGFVYWLATVNADLVYDFPDEKAATKWRDALRRSGYEYVSPMDAKQPRWARPHKSFLPTMLPEYSWDVQHKRIKKLSPTRYELSLYANAGGRVTTESEIGALVRKFRAAGYHIANLELAVERVRKIAQDAKSHAALGANRAKRTKSQAEQQMTKTQSVKYDASAVAHGKASALQYLNDAVRIMARRGDVFAMYLRKNIAYVTTERWAEAIAALNKWITGVQTYHTNDNELVSAIATGAAKVQQAVRILRAIQKASENSPQQQAAVDSPVTKAAHLYLDRQARRSNPDGKFDKSGRWYPSSSEKQPCCARVRQPSRAYPYSLMTHCRSAEHIANLMNVSLPELKQAIRSLGGSTAMRHTVDGVTITRSVKYSYQDTLVRLVYFINKSKQSKEPGTFVLMRDGNNVAVKWRHGNTVEHVGEVASQDAFRELLSGLRGHGRTISNRVGSAPFLSRINKSAATKEVDGSSIPLGTIKLLVQTMPKELRAMHLATQKLDAAAAILSPIDNDAAQGALRFIATVRQMTATRYKEIDTEWRALARELQKRGESAATITPLYGRAKSNSTKLDIGPFRIRLDNKGDIDKAKKRLAEVQQAISKLQPSVAGGAKLMQSIQNAVDYLSGASDYMDTAEQTIPGTQLGGLVPMFGAAMRKVAQVYQLVAQQIAVAKKDLAQLQQEAGQLKQQIQKAGG